ncbi:ubiquitin carboxyl-terminal hydrolase-like protein, partial [Euroglyphus maynei]
EKNSSVARRLEFDETTNSGSTFSHPHTNTNVRSIGSNTDENSGTLSFSSKNLNRQANNETNTNVQVMTNECERYQLVSVICHQGPSITCGHYTCYVYNFNYQKWYHCDDSIITEVPFSQLEKNSLTTGYCYFYARTDHNHHS